MAIVQIGYFKERNGVRTYSVQGDKADIYKLIEELRQADAKFDDTPNIVHVHRSTWSVLLKIKMPLPVEVGGST